jgi:hypothetical protein
VSERALTEDDMAETAVNLQLLHLISLQLAGPIDDGRPGGVTLLRDGDIGVANSPKKTQRTGVGRYTAVVMYIRRAARSSYLFLMLRSV